MGGRNRDVAASVDEAVMAKMSKTQLIDAVAEASQLQKNDIKTVPKP